MWRVHRSGGLFHGSTLIHRMWRQIAVTFGPVSIERLLQMIEYAMRSRVLGNEEVAILLCCLGGETTVTQALLGCYMLVPRGEVPFLLPLNNRK